MWTKRGDANVVVIVSESLSNRHIQCHTVSKTVWACAAVYQTFTESKIVGYLVWYFVVYLDFKSLTVVQ